MKRRLLLLMGALFLMTIGQTAFAQDETLTIWVWDINKPIVEASIESFQEAYPNVKFDVQDLGNQNTYDRGLAGCAAGGLGMPDIYLIENNEAPVFWAQFPECFADLREFGAEDIYDLFPEFKWTELMVGETVYAIPFDMGPTAIFYRRDLWETAEIDVEAIETWDDFLEAGLAIQAANSDDLKIVTFGKGGDDDWFRMLANQAGCFYFDVDGTEVTVNQPGCVLAVETLGKLWDAGIFLNGGWDDQLQAISNNDVAASFFGSWYAGVIQSNSPEQEGLWGVFATPALTEGGVRASNLGGSAFAIPSSSQNKELAYAFLLNLLTNEENAETTLLDYGLSVSLLSVSDSEAVQQPVSFFGDQPVWDVIYTYANDVPAANGTQFFQEARQVITIELSNFLDGQYDSAQAMLDSAARQISGITGLPIAEADEE